LKKMIVWPGALGDNKRGMPAHTPIFSRLALVLLVLVLFVAGCRDDASKPPEPQAGQPQLAPPQALPSEIAPVPGSAAIVVPDSVRKKWRAVRLQVTDKTANVASEHVVSIGGTLEIPDSQIKVKVGDFLPDLKVEEAQFTTASEELSNPSVHVTVEDGGKQIFDGWLFQLFPTVHPFQHDRYSIVLREAVAAQS
jgi:hypothetical protein